MRRFGLDLPGARDEILLGYDAGGDQAVAEPEEDGLELVEALEADG